MRGLNDNLATTGEKKPFDLRTNRGKKDLRLRIETYLVVGVVKVGRIPEKASEVNRSKERRESEMNQRSSDLAIHQSSLLSSESLRLTVTIKDRYCRRTSGNDQPNQKKCRLMSHCQS